MSPTGLEQLQDQAGNLIAKRPKGELARFDDPHPSHAESFAYAQMLRTLPFHAPTDLLVNDSHLLCALHHHDVVFPGHTLREVL